MIIHQAIQGSEWVVILSHGFRGSKDGGGRAVLLADQIAALNVNVVRYDFTPLQNLTTQVAELSKIVEFAEKNVGKKIVLLGRSMGGAASLIYAAKHNNIQGLCLWSTPADLKQTFQLALGKVYDVLVQGLTAIVSDEYGEVELNPDFISDFAQYHLYAEITRIEIPLLLLHGSADKIVPIRQAQRLYALAKAPKALHIIADGDHQFSCHSQQVQQKVLSWLQRIITPSI